MEKVFDYKFRTRELCQISKIPNGVLGKWMHRGDLVAEGDLQQGKERDWTFNQVLEVAVAYSFASVNKIPVKTACKAGKMIAHTPRKGHLVKGLPNTDLDVIAPLSLPTNILAQADTFKVVGPLSEMEPYLSDGTFQADASFAFMPYHNLFQTVVGRIAELNKSKLTVEDVLLEAKELEMRMRTGA